MPSNPPHTRASHVAMWMCTDAEGELLACAAARLTIGGVGVRGARAYKHQREQPRIGRVNAKERRSPMNGRALAEQ